MVSELERQQSVWEVNGRRSRAEEEVLWRALMEDFLLLSLKHTQCDPSWQGVGPRIQRTVREGGGWGGLHSIDWPVNQSRLCLLFFYDFSHHSANNQITVGESVAQSVAVYQTSVLFGSDQFVFHAPEDPKSGREYVVSKSGNHQKPNMSFTSQF